MDPTTAKASEMVHEVDENRWILAQVMISRHTTEPPSGAYWADGEGGFLSISKAPDPLPPTREQVSASCPIVPIFFTDGELGLWRIGPCELRMWWHDDGTLEHVILEKVREKKLEYKWSFEVPQTYYSAQHGDKYYIVTGTLAGKSLCEVWPTIEDEALKKSYARQIAEAYRELSRWEGKTDQICGVDGEDLKELFLGKPELNEKGEVGEFAKDSHTPQQLLSNCKEIGMKCEDVVFCHNNWRPHSFVVDGNKLVGIIRWEEAGFVPRDWIRTKPSCNSLFHDKSCTARWSEEQEYEWCEKVYDALKELEPLDGKAFRDMWEAFDKWTTANREELMQAQNHSMRARGAPQSNPTEITQR
ncbi:hypothetical protein ACHAPT_006761 [Fusarium lateritium]